MNFEISPLFAIFIVGGIGSLTVMLTVYVLRLRTESLARSENNRAEIDKLTSDVKRLQDQVVPLYQGFQNILGDHLTHPSDEFKEADLKLASLRLFEITDDDRQRLTVLMKQRSVTDNPKVSDQEKNEALVMIAVMPLVVEERAQAAKKAEDTKQAEAESFAAGIESKQAEKGG